MLACGGKWNRRTVGYAELGGCALVPEEMESSGGWGGRRSLETDYVVERIQGRRKAVLAQLTILDWMSIASGASQFGNDF